jgi:hypothetical protein
MLKNHSFLFAPILSYIFNFVFETFNRTGLIMLSTLTVGQLGNLSKRQKSKDLVPLKHINLIDIENLSGINPCFLLKFKVKSQTKDEFYSVDIKLYTDDVIKMTSLCKVECDCKDFIFRCSYELWKRDTLVSKHDYIKPPKKSSGVSVCYHVYSVIKYVQLVGSITELKKRLNK